MDEDDYFLKWEKHHNAFVSGFDYLYKHDILVDCTLAAEEKHIKVHRIVLMACSPYLQKILCEHSDNYPIVFFDIKFTHLEAIINFCYRGEVKVPFNELEGFLEAATMLQIKGLCKKSESDVVSDNSDNNKRRLSFNSSNTVESVNKKKKKVSSNNDSDSKVTTDGEAAVDEVADKEKPNRNGFSQSPLAMESDKSKDDLLNMAGETQGSDNSDVDSDDTGGSSGPEDIDRVDDYLNSSSALLFPWTCNRCGEAFATRAPYEEHRRNCVRVDYATHPWKCHKCTNAYKNKKDLVRHLIYCGNNIPRLYCNRCGNSYKYERGLKRHQIYCGTDVKPLKCPQCDKIYKYKRGLRRHQRRCGIAEALQFLAGKGVTPVVVTKRSLGLPYLGDISKSGFPMINSTPKLSQLSSIDKSINKIQENIDTSSLQQALENAAAGNSLVAEASVCLCGKVYKYKKSYDKHIASCACGNQMQDDSRKQVAVKSRKDSDGEEDDDDEEEDDENNDDENEEEGETKNKDDKKNGENHTNNSDDEDADGEEEDDSDEEEENKDDIKDVKEKNVEDNEKIVD